MEIHGIYRGLITACLFMLASFADATVDCVPPPLTTPEKLEVQRTVDPAIPYPVVDPQKVADVFIAAVGRGELVLFGDPLAANALDPRRVEYVYSLQTADPLPTVRVHAVLTQPFPLPAAPQIHATSVTGVLDWDGRIIDSFVHCE